MATKTKKLKIDEKHEITLISYTAGTKPHGRFVLAHGAGADQNHRFMVLFGEGLAARGVETTTFNFVYTENKKRAPDKPPLLEATYRAVVESVGAPVFIGGKSMGGRIASQIAASGTNVLGLIFLGYPLHPPGKPEQLRVAHWPKITAPILFVQGEKDAFGSPDEILAQTKTLRAKFQMYPVAGGDHSLGVGKKALAAAGLTQEKIYTNAMDAIAAFIFKNAK
ncbi:MAG: alpha/beta family hydrolase [Polyangiaceae bacterium]